MTEARFKVVDKYSFILKLIFYLITIISISGYILWGYQFYAESGIWDVAMFQILFAGFWVDVAVLITLYEIAFTKKKVLGSLWAAFFVFISIFIPLLNFLVLLPIAFYIGIKNLIMAIKKPKEYGGFALSLLVLGFATITLIKSIEVYILYLMGTI